VLVAACCSMASAEQMTAGDLLQMCTSSNDSQKAACSFYIWGIAEGATLAANTERNKAGEFVEVKEKQICLPDDFSKSAMELVVRMSLGQDLAVYTKDKDLPAVSFVLAVLRSKFSCAKSK
jgi:hypothetical protein